jgi:transposase-like protein
MRAKAQLEHELVKSLSFKRHRFPADVIVHAVWLYFRFTLSFRDVEEMLSQRGIDVSMRRSAAGQSSSARKLRAA